MDEWTDDHEGAVMKELTDKERIERLEKELSALKHTFRTIGGKIRIHSEGILTPGLKALMEELGNQLYAIGRDGG